MDRRLRRSADRAADLTAAGADCLPELVPVALVALAGFGATLATQGWLRRLVGAILLAGGLWVAVRAGDGDGPANRPR